MLAQSDAKREISISEIKEHLISEGYDFESGHQQLDDRLAATCNSVQRKRLDKAWATRKESLRLDRLYKFPESLKQAHLLFSHDRLRILHSYKWLLDTLPNDAGTVADVGCATGTLSRLIAHHFPQASVLGIDLSANLIAAANRESKSPNIRYEASDMADLNSFGCFDNIVSACGIEVPYLPEPTFEEIIAHEGERLLPDFRALISKAYRPMLAGTRKAASENGRLIAVFRIPTLLKFEHIVDVAAECGWRLVTPPSDRISAGEEKFFSAQFRTSEPWTTDAES